MSKNDYDVLAEQIGDLGAEPQGQNGLGKLEHKSAYGAKEDLTSEEQKSLDSFLSRSDAKREAQYKASTEEAPIADGWVPVNRSELGNRSMFYPETWEFYIRPATVKAIKNWLSIDESNLMQLNKVFNEIMKLCVRIVDGENAIAWGNINSWDRFWFILKVRELTFASNKKTIDYEDECESCGQDLTFELRAENLFYEFPDNDLVEHYWNGSTWDIDPAEYDIDHEPITLYMPTLAKEEAIINWARREQERNKKKEVDETFPKYAIWMISKPSRDADQFDRQMSKAYNEYKRWDVSFFKFMDQVVNNITINPKETLKQVCPHCGEEVASDVRFPNGVKALFDVETGGKKFGSRG